jgi:hypothetical protein
LPEYSAATKPTYAMNKAVKYLLYTLGLVAVLVSGLLLYVKTQLPDVGPPPDITVQITPERVQRGHYLANHVMLCMDCHAVRDFSLFSGPPIPGTLGAGGDVFDQAMGFPGRFIARNITPAGVGNWTDGELYRAITTGVSKDGHAFFPVMPYPLYGQLDDEDIYAVIAYLRSLEPVENELDTSAPDFPMNLILNTIPKKGTPTKRPPKSDVLAYGKYMTTASGCIECHTNFDKGKQIGEPFAGGRAFNFPDGSTLRSSNITPHATGIGLWTMEQFVARFKAYADSSYVPERVNPGEFQTVMPWMMYAGMDTEDLEAIYTYLRSLPAVDHRVERFTSSGLASK